jgi:hypothetical protein
MRVARQIIAGGPRRVQKSVMDMPLDLIDDLVHVPFRIADI